MSDESHREMVTLRDYVDTRFAAEAKAVILALETVKAAMERDDKRWATWLSLLAVILSVAMFVYTVAKHA